MAKAKSGWDFGELFPVEQTRRIFSVAELTKEIRRVLEARLGSIWIAGEITNLRSQSSGHVYFTLKDASAQIQCVLFRTEPVENRALLQDGQSLILQGELTVYEPRGQYQLVVRAIELRGIGALQAAFERLKQKLQAEGLFAPERKRPLPQFANRIGLVTSATGAAIQDVLHVVRRRYPGLEIVLSPTRVQGDGAGAEIAEAIRFLNRWNDAQPGEAKLDLILLTRGGGSLEDLWAFNEEVVARALFDSALPVISAIGHEIDFTISDFVADVRAATPSAAAMMITEGAFAARQFLAEIAGRLNFLARRELEVRAQTLQRLKDQLRRLQPRRVLQERAQYLDDLLAAMARCGRHALRESSLTCGALAGRLLRLHPRFAIATQRDRWGDLLRRLHEGARRLQEKKGDDLQRATGRLQLLSPAHVLARGYSITLDSSTGRVIRSAAEVHSGQKLRTRLMSGEIQSTVQTDSTSEEVR